MGVPKYRISLTQQVREILLRITKKHTEKQSVVEACKDYTDGRCWQVESGYRSKSGRERSCDYHVDETMAGKSIRTCCAKAARLAAPGGSRHIYT